MRKLLLGLGLLAALVTPVRAQVSVELALDQDQFLPGEALPVTVRVTNRSGQSLDLGKEPDWLTFSVQAQNRVAEFKNEDVPVMGEFVLESSQVAIKHVNLVPYFTLGLPGRYSVVATVRVREWDREVSSPPKHFYIIEGAKLWEQTFGMPTPPGATNALPEVRKYLLQEANYLRGELRLYLRITDASGEKTIRVAPVGQIVSVSHPEPQVDRFSNLHLLYQDGARTFNYSVFTPEGELLLRQTYEYVDVRPRLRTDDTGLISVYGGVRLVTAKDIPRSTNDVPGYVEPPPHVKPIEPAPDAK